MEYSDCASFCDNYMLSRRYLQIHAQWLSMRNCSWLRITGDSLWIPCLMSRAGVNDMSTWLVISCLSFLNLATFNLSPSFGSPLSLVTIPPFCPTLLNLYRGLFFTRSKHVERISHFPHYPFTSLLGLHTFTQPCRQARLPQ